MITRVYMNSLDPSERLWSVDHGDSNTEETVDSIVIRGGVWQTGENRQSLDNEAKAWLESEGCDVFIEEHGSKRQAVIL